MQAPPIDLQEIEARLDGHVDELLELWWIEQGQFKSRDLKLIASVVPFPTDAPIRVLDLCCGPGDVGRAIAMQFPNAQIDCIDRDPFLASMCRIENARKGIPGNVVIRDLNDEALSTGLSSGYHVVATVNALHQFRVPQALSVLRDVSALLHDDGVFLMAEPVAASSRFADGFEHWKRTLPPRYTRENWERFWTRANEILGYDHIELLGERDPRRIDADFTVDGWSALLSDARFKVVDLLLRDADQVILAAAQPSP